MVLVFFPVPPLAPPKIKIIMTMMIIIIMRPPPETDTTEHERVGRAYEYLLKQSFK